MIANSLFLVVPNREINQFASQSDRDFFSAPVQVELHHSCVSTRMLYVLSPLQGGVVYPVCKSQLKRGYHLTNKQLQSARTV